MTQHPTLSLCIPTFRRPECLKTLLESVSRQSSPFDEVIVSDDASGDETREVVEGFKAEIPNLFYSEVSPNVGLDENFRRCVRMSTGDYVWFMGDDDRLRPGAVVQARSLLAAHPGVFGATVGSVDYDSRLEQPTGMRKLPSTQVILGAKQLFSDHLHLLGFMSTMIVSRRRWNEAPSAETGRFDNLYSQVHRLGRMVGDTGPWLVSDALLVDYRSDNDQFKGKLGGSLPRLKRDVEAYAQIIDDIFSSDSQARHAASDRLLKTHVISRVRNSAVSHDRSEGVATLRYLAPRFSHHTYFWRNVVPTALTPNWVLRPLRLLYKRLNPSSGAAMARVFQHDAGEDT